MLINVNCSLEDFVLSIDLENLSLQEFEIIRGGAMNSGQNSVRLLPHDSGIDNEERVIISATNAHLQDFARSESRSRDGKFALAPRVSCSCL